MEERSVSEKSLNHNIEKTYSRSQLGDKKADIDPESGAAAQTPVVAWRVHRYPPLRPKAQVKHAGEEGGSIRLGQLGQKNTIFGGAQGKGCKMSKACILPNKGLRMQDVKRVFRPPTPPLLSLFATRRVSYRA